MNIYQNIIFSTLDYLRRRKNIERLKFLRKSQYWSKSKLEEWQTNRLNGVLKTAKEKSQFYKEKLRDIKLPLNNIDELQYIPILTKKEIRSNLESMKCINVPRGLFILGKTGGSTGEPMHFFEDKRGRDWNRGCVYRSQEWADAFLGERTVQMTGSHYDETEFKKLKWKLIYWLQRYRNLPVSIINDDILEKYYKDIVRYKPTSIWGYSSGIYFFAKFIEKNYKNANFNFLKAIITSSETLYNFQREKINQVFGNNKVYDHYGSREFYIASECKEHKGYHMHSEVILLEIVDDKGMHKKPGELGRIITTDLSNLVFPFIRYEIGDVGILSDEKQCPCGITLPKLKSVEGRIAEVIVLPDRVLTPPNFTILLSDFEGIEQYQIIQKSKTELILKIIKNKKYTKEYEHYIKGSLGRLAGHNIGIRIEYVDEIETPPSGKRKYIISEISSNHL